MPPTRFRPKSVLVIFMLALVVSTVQPVVPVGAQDDTDDAVADRVIERYKQILRTNPRELGAFDRLYDIYSERSSVQALLDEYTALSHAEPDEPSHWVVLGHIAKRRSDWDGAKAAYAKAIALAPDDAYARQMLGDVHVRRREWADAAKAYAAALERHPPLDDTIAILKALGRCYSELGRRERAIETWNTIVELDPKGVFTRLELAELYRDLHLLDEAIAQYEGIAAIESSDPYWTCKARIEIGRIDDQLDRTAEALEAYEQALALTASDSWLRTEIVGLINELFYSRGDPDGLAAYWRAKLEKNPKDLEAIAQLAAALAAMGHDDEAVAQYLDGLEHAPSSVPLRTALIGLLVDIGRYDDAVPHARRLVKDHPATVEHHRLLGEILFRAGRLDEAKQALRGVLTGGSTDPNRHLALAELYARFDFVDEAIAAHEAAIRLAPDNPDYVIALGEYYIALFRYREALAAFRRIVEGEGRATAASFGRLAEVLDHHGFADEAIEAAARAVELAPDDFELADRYARLLAKRERADEALAVLEGLLDKAPNEFFRVDVEDRIFAILRRQGKLQERIEAAEKALGSHPGVDDLLRLARMYARIADADKERKCLERARTVAPDSVDVLRRLAQLLQHAGQVPDAVKINEQLVKLDAANAREYLETITGLYLFKGQEQQARDTAKRVVARRPKEPGGYALLARVEARFGHLDEAIDAMREAIARRPKSPDLHAELSRLYERADRLDEAIEELWRCWQIEESGFQRLVYVHALDALYQSQGRVDELKERLRAMTRRTRRDPFARFALAEVERSSGDIEAAKRELTRLHARQPKDTETLLQLVSVCRELGELDEAIRYQERATQLDPSQSNRRALGELFYEAGRDAEAIEAWSKLTKERATDPRSYIELAKLLLRYNLQDAALDALMKADRLEPKEWRTLYELAELYEDVAQWTMAAAVYERLLDLPDEEPADAKAPSATPYLAGSSRWRSSPSVLAPPNTGSPLLDRLLMLERAAQLILQQRYGGRTVWSPMSLAEAKVAGYVKLVYVHEAAGTLDRFERALAALPAEGRPTVEQLQARIEFLYVLGRTDECLELLDQIIASEPDEVGHRIASASLASKIGDVARLETAYGFLLEKEDSRAAQYIETLIRLLVKRHDEEKLAQYVDEIVDSAKTKKTPFATAISLTIAAGNADRTRELVDAMLADKDTHPSNLYNVASIVLNSRDLDLGTDLITQIEKRVSESDSSGMSFARLYQQAYQAAQNAGDLDRTCRYALCYLEHSSPRRKPVPPPKPGGNTWSNLCSTLNNRLRHESTAYNPASSRQHPYLESTHVLDGNRVGALVLAIESSHALDDDGRVREALEHWADAAEGMAKIDPLVALSYVAFLYGDSEQAAAYVDQAIELDAHNLDLLALKLHLLWLRGEYATALSLLEDRRTQDGHLPTDVAAVIEKAAAAVGLDELADRMTGTLLEADLPFNTLCSMASQMLARGKRDTARELILKAAEAVGSEVDQRLRLAGLFAKLGEQNRAAWLAAGVLKRMQATSPPPNTNAPPPTRRADTANTALLILRDAGRHDEIARYLEQTERSSHTASELYALANMHQMLGDTAGQAAVLLRIAKLARGDANVLLQTARMLRQLGYVNEAIDLYRAMLSRPSGHVSNYYYEIIRCFFDSGRQAELIDVALRGSGRPASRLPSYGGRGYAYPGSTPLLEQLAGECSNRGMRREAIALYERAMQVSPGAAPRTASRLAQLYMANGEPAKAAALMERAILGRPGTSTRWVMMGGAAYALSPQEAVRDLAEARRQLGTLDELIERLERDVDAKPRDSALRTMLFELYLQDARGAEARALAESVIQSASPGTSSSSTIRLAPPPGAPSTGIGFVGRLASSGFYEDAAALCDAMLEQCRAEGRTDLDLLGCAASVHARMGDIEQARALSMELVEHASSAQQRRYLYSQGQLLAQSGAFDDALAVYERLARSGRADDHQTRNAQQAVLRLALRTGRLDQMLAAVPDEIVPVDDRRYGIMAATLYEMRCYREAAWIYTRMLDSNPRNAYVRVQLVSCLQTMGDIGQAAEHRAVLVRQFPAETAHLYELAQLYGRMEQYDRQQDVLETLVERDPSARSYGQLAAFYASRQQYEKLIEARRKLVELQPGSASARADLANAYIAAGDKEKALEVWREIPTIDPGPRGWLMLADGCRRVERPDEALAACDKAAALDPRDANTLRALGNAYKAAGDIDKAVAVYRTLPTLSNTAASWLELGNLLQSANKNDEALTAYETALKLAPSNTTALRQVLNTLKTQHDYEQMCDTLLRAIEHGWASRYRYDLMQLVVQTAASASNEEGAAVVRQRLADGLADMTSMPATMRADLLVQLAGRWPSDDQDGRTRLFDKARDLSGDDPQALSRVASALGGMGKHDEAIAIYRQLTERDPWAGSSGVQLVQQLAAANRTEEARQELERLAEKAVTGDQLAAVAARFAGTPIDDPDRAIELYERAAKRRPSNWSSALSLATILIKQNRTDDAFAILECATRVSPQASAYRDFAGMLARSDLKAEAERYYRLAMQAEPRSSHYVLEFGRFLVENGRRDDAVALYEKARETFSLESDCDRFDEEIKKLKGSAGLSPNVHHDAA